MKSMHSIISHIFQGKHLFLLTLKQILSDI